MRNSLSHNSLTSNGIVNFIDVLKNQEVSLTSMNLSKNLLNDEAMKSLGECLQHLSSLKKLGLGWNNISDKGIDDLFPYLSDNQSLKILDLSGNENITDKSLPGLIKAMNETNIEDIHVYRTKITRENDLLVPSLSNQLKRKVDKIEFFGK